ncbi:30S ribosomal protein S15 [Nitrosopumilaceae archaeon]|nr:30S ribosomal protein S15 [Nitrosopumilus sp.]MDA7945594.1 30S ribosomal protein S15 [Nitrosopumilus sp.]MDA7954358.1 30S ribosomal protein S15 [Nitrosopumilus sp.]MDA7973398.1 30S ribosomal protein S15 [Nitrosopumilus sp.]CAI9831579.1 30S ribosomal protein S15 [Nitrosopumilaceae archaeon]
MGRMHTHRRGKSHSIRPAEPRAPAWEVPDAARIEEMITEYAKEGLTPSQIGIRLRDQHAVPLARVITGRGIGETLADKGLVSEMPEDLDNMVRKAVGLQRHLKENKGDKRNVRSLELIEAKVHRLSVYYKRIGRIPGTWKYKSVVAQLE